MGLFGPPNVDKMKAMRDMEVDELIRTLVNSNRNKAHERAGVEAAQPSWRIKDPRAIEPLLRVAIESTIFRQVQRAAREALVEIGDSRIVRLALDWLEGGDRTTQKCIYAAKRLLNEMITRRADCIAPGDLRAVANIRDTTRAMAETRRDSPTDDVERLDYTSKIDNSELRRIAAKALARRGLEV